MKKTVPKGKSAPVAPPVMPGPMSGMPGMVPPTQGKSPFPIKKKGK